jgi:hypothetical protein
MIAGLLVRRSTIVMSGGARLYTALDVRTGKVHGKAAARHSSDEFVEFLGEIVTLYQPVPRDPRDCGQSVSPPDKEGARSSSNIRTYLRPRAHVHVLR